MSSAFLSAAAWAAVNASSTARSVAGTNRVLPSALPDSSFSHVDTPPLRQYDADRPSISFGSFPRNHKLMSHVRVTHPPLLAGERLREPPGVPSVGHRSGRWGGPPCTVREPAGAAAPSRAGANAGPRRLQGTDAPAAGPGARRELRAWSHA